jgi:hypothetical protein
VSDRLVNPQDDVATLLSTATIDGAPIGEAERNAYFLIIAQRGTTRRARRFRAGCSR